MECIRFFKNALHYPKVERIDLSQGESNRGTLLSYIFKKVAEVPGVGFGTGEKEKENIY